MNFVSGENLCGACAPPRSLPSPSPPHPCLSGGVVRPIKHRARVYQLGAPIACQSSDKMDFQLSQGSQARSGRMENRRTSVAPLPLLTFCQLFVFLFRSPGVLGPCPSPPPSAPALSVLSDVLAGATRNEYRLVVKVQIPMRQPGGSVSSPRRYLLSP